MKESIGLALRGFCMGVADIIPGVSGGTMALVLGIYQRLLESIRMIDLGVLPCLVNSGFYKRILSRLTTPLAPPGSSSQDARADAIAFLIVLLAGIGTAIITAAKFIPTWMENYPELMRGFFFGLILISIAAPARQMKAPDWRKLAMPLLLTAALTTWMLGGTADNANFAKGVLEIELAEALTEEVSVSTDTRFVDKETETLGKHGQGLKPLKPVIAKAGDNSVRIPVIAIRSGDDGNRINPQKVINGPEIFDGASIVVTEPLTGGVSPELWFVFVSGSIAICAMILPGVSGAFLLLLLGQYHYVLFHLRAALGGAGESISILLVFLLGITVGILAFSRVLTALLNRAHDETMAVLMGLMLGSLTMLWPYQNSSGSAQLPGEGTSFMPFLSMAIGAGLIALFLYLDKSHTESDGKAP